MTPTRLDHPETRGRGLRIEPLPAPRGLDDPGGPVTVAESLRPLGPVALLEAADPGGGAGGWTYVVAGPAARVRTRRGGTWLEGPRGCTALAADPCSALDHLCARLGLTPDAPVPDGAPPFTGGLVGAVSYDLARSLESVGSHARDDRAVPALDLHVAETVVAMGPGRDEVLLVQRPLVSSSERLTEVAAAVRASLPGRAAGDGERTREEPQRVRTTLPGPAYQRVVREALEHVGAGEVFQVNLSQRLTARWRGSPWTLYRGLRSHSPAPHGAIVPVGRGTAVSISPETFLTAHGRVVATVPIKGTRPRSPDADEDRRLAAELGRSGKDRAENVMIVDVERNDLGRVCETGSVSVPRLVEVTAHPTVWHLESEIAGRLGRDHGWGGLLRACFPSGSVTGAPKVRAMQLIDTLEPVRRGVYCGAVGFLSAGRVRLSVAIRTALVHCGRADWGTGGGVVADSDPAAEHAESLDKAVPFLRTVGATELIPDPAVRTGA